ncbi:MAG: ABC transporter substrate-binding protein [Deltaproteobacteria bacterium]|nr:ABC transporter substrate-binding protein [Deltaproteobacteria bacterium]
MPRRRRPAAPLLIPALLSLLALSCHRAPAPPPVLRLGYAPHDHHAPLFVAALGAATLRAMGSPYLVPGSSRSEYALRRGDRVVATVQLVPCAGGRELPRRLAEDLLDMAFGGFPAFVQQIDRGAPLRIVAPTMTGGAGLVVGSSLGVHDWKEFVARVRKDRRPLRIGYRADGAVQRLLLEQALAGEDLSVGARIDDAGSQVALVNLYGAENLLPALRNGVVDGFVGVQPYLALAEEQGVGRVVTDLREAPCSGGGACAVPCCALALRTDFGAAHPEVVEAVVDMARGASRYLTDHPQQAAALVARWLGTSPEVEQRSIPTIRFVTELDSSWNRGARGWAETMVRSGGLTGAVATALKQNRLSEAIYDPTVLRHGRQRR